MATRRILAIVLPLLSVLLLTSGVVIGRGLAAPNDAPNTAADLASAFTYQGNLTDANGPVSNACDFRFSLFDAIDNGTQIGNTLDRQNVEVIGGLFNVQLDFGSGAFDGGDRFLEIEVRCPSGGGIFTTLSPRQPLTPTPYAIYAFNAPWSGLRGVPDSFADGEDSDALSGLSCEHSQVAKWNDIAQAWQCAFTDDEVDTSQDFTESVTFTVPDGVKRLQVEVWGAGGGGGYHGTGGLAGGGGGGGSGGYTLKLIDVTPGEELTIVIGTGGERAMDDGTPATEGGETSIKRSESVLAAATGGKPGSDAGDGTCSPDVPGIGGDPGEGGKGDTSDGNPGTMGGTGARFGFPVSNCFQGIGGPGGEAVEGTVTPVGSTGGYGGGRIQTIQVPPAPGGAGYVFIRW